MNNKEYQALTAPRVYWNQETLTSAKGELIAEPLEPGFGQTLGNALRRTMLGAVEGSAVTSVIIKGVNNEFSVIPGVVEDVVQLILNIKGIVIKNNTGKPGVMQLSWGQEGVVTAGSIVADEHLSVLNKDHVLAHISLNGSLDITFFVESGRGYVPAQWPTGKPLQEDNRIYIDALFSPVTQVTFDVQKTRVGTSIDYDKLTMQVITNGTMEPTEVLHYAVSVLRGQLQSFLNADEIAFEQITHSPVIGKKADLQSQSNGATQVAVPMYGGVPADLFFKTVTALDFPVRAHNCLMQAGIKRVIDLVSMTPEDILAIKNFGRKSLDEVRDVLAQQGLSLGMRVQEEEIKALLEESEEL